MPANSSNQQGQTWKVVGRSAKYVAGAVITQSVEQHSDSDGWLMRFTATIRGWRGFLIAEGCPGKGDFHFQDVINKVQEIRDRIDAGDESVFYEDHPIAPRHNQPAATGGGVEAVSTSRPSGAATG